MKVRTMKTTTILLILFSVGLSAGAQLLLKYGMSSAPIQRILAVGNPGELIRTVACNGYVIAGLLLYGFGALVWLLVLSRIDVSLAYPFVGLGIVITMILAPLFLGEILTMPRILGGGLVVAGICILSLRG